jgi:hypothetical protein
MKCVLAIHELNHFTYDQLDVDKLRTSRRSARTRIYRFSEYFSPISKRMIIDQRMTL